MFAFSFSKYGEKILDRYNKHLPYWNTITIPFASFQAASAITNTIVMDECTDDLLILDVGVNFSNRLVNFLVKDNTQYAWSQEDRFTPISTIAGFATQVMPVLPLPIEFFLPKNNKLQWQFQNSASSPTTTDQLLTIRGLRLKDPIAA